MKAIKNYYNFNYAALLFLIISFPINKTHSQNKYNTGLLFDSNNYNQIETISKALKFSETNRSNYSLKKYCPTPGNQNPLGTCASWATGYAAMTISYAIQNNIINKVIINKNAKSAMYLYNQVGNSQTCSGSYIEKNLEICKIKGDCDFLDFNPSGCQISPNYNLHLKANQFKIQDYNTLFLSFANPNQKISSVINSLNSNKPVIVSLKVSESLNEVKKDGLYTPNKNYNGRHAVCLVAYDNALKQFEFINSWGTEWGNNGFFKMSYDDFKRDCMGAFQFVLVKNKNSEKILKGSFQLLNFTKINNKTGWPEFSVVTTSFLKKGVYSLSKNVKKDEFFRLKAKDLTTDTYIYVLSFKPNRKAEILFPLNYSKTKNDSIVDIPLVTNSDATIELPEDINNGYSTDQIGEDYMCILFSKSKILNLDKLIKNIENSNSILTWLDESFGNDLINSDQIDYANGEMSFSSKSNSKGNIVPIILKVNVN